MIISKKLALSLLASSIASVTAAETVGYNADVRPILSDKCFLCHGPDTANNKAGLRLDLQESAFAELRDSPGKFGIVPKSLEKSEVWQRIMLPKGHADIMPTAKSNLVVTEKEKETIAAWIKQGAKYEPHWSFVNLPEKIEVPKTLKPDWAKNPIDHFVAARLEQEKLEPSPEADPTRWLRRVTFDLTGLPPTLEEITNFEKDYQSKGDAIYQEVVERLLGTVAYAENMAIPWLDASRYADTWGYHADDTFTAWPYRDWVVKAFKEDMPYDQFVTENIAGDLIPNASNDQILATAFNRLNRMTNEGGSSFEEFRIDGVSDRVNTVGTAFLGLTMECAKCHDHKYDPITAKDYFELSAFFNSINESGLYNHGNISPPPSLLLPTPEQKKAHAQQVEQAKQLKTTLAKLEEFKPDELTSWKEQQLDPANLILKDQTGHFSFEKSAKEPFASAVKHGDKALIGESTERRLKLKFTSGPENHGSALALDGDIGFQVKKFFHVDRYTPFTIGLWLKDTLRTKEHSVVLQRTFGTEVGYNGTELALEDGYLVARIYRHWPDNGIGIRSQERLPQNEWNHLTWTYDASSTAAGLSLYLNGEPIATKVIGDQLYKSTSTTTYTKGHFAIGTIFRGRGFKGGQVDELQTFSRALSPIEVRHISGKTDIAESLKTAPQEEIYSYYLANHHAEYRETLAQYSDAQKAITKTEDGFIEVPVMKEMAEPRPAYILDRGEYNLPITENGPLKRDSLSFLLPFPEDAPRDRLGLAQWLTLPNHPLTSRVYVNRIWQQLWGEGLVGTAENFGLQGDLPTHPELLDWLARDFVNHGWSTKHLIKQIVLSSTYRQKSALTPVLQSMDIANKLLARGPSHRLAGEQIRDAALASSGLLNRTQGGEPVLPFDPLNNNDKKKAKVKKDNHRRSLYTFWKRTKPQSSMIIFDKPSLEVCSVKRTRTNSPAQALVGLNDPQFVEAARHQATTMLQEKSDDASRIKTAWKKVTSREPNEREFTLLNEILTDARTYFSDKPKEAAKLLKVGFKKAPQEIDAQEAAAFTVVCQAIYNTDAAIWKR